MQLQRPTPGRLLLAASQLYYAMGSFIAGESRKVPSNQLCAGYHRRLQNATWLAVHPLCVCSLVHEVFHRRVTFSSPSSQAPLLPARILSAL